MTCEKQLHIFCIIIQKIMNAQFVCLSAKKKSISYYFELSKLASVEGQLVPSVTDCGTVDIFSAVVTDETSFFDSSVVTLHGASKIGNLNSLCYY